MILISQKKKKKNVTLQKFKAILPPSHHLHPAMADSDVLKQSSLYMGFIFVSMRIMCTDHSFLRRPVTCIKINIIVIIIIM